MNSNRHKQYSIKQYAVKWRRHTVCEYLQDHNLKAIQRSNSLKLKYKLHL